MNCRWSDYNMFSATPGINMLFYWIQSVNIQRYGRNGISKELALGDFLISKQFHLTSLSLRLFHKLGGSMLLIIGMFGWLTAHVLWFDFASANVLYKLLVMFLCLISTTFYANLFDRQNYNVFGWMFFPIGLFGILTGNYFTASVAWLCISFGSFTAFYIAVWVTIALALLKSDWFVLLTLCLGLVKITTHFLPLISKNRLLESLAFLGKGIGLTRRAVRYKRRREINLRCFYFLILWTGFSIVVYLYSTPTANFTSWQLACLAGVAPLFWLTNSLISRFADDQSLYMLFLSLSSAVMMLQSNLLVIILFWISISPIPRWLEFPGEHNILDIVPRRKPFLIRPLIDYAYDFLRQVPQDSKVLFAWNDPQGKYSNIFDDYRVTYELFLYVASCRRINLFPDWYAVLENNYKDAPSFWGREINQVVNNLKFWKADFVIIYQDSGKELDPEWEKSGFSRLGFFSWKEVYDNSCGRKLFETNPIDLWLLKCQSFTIQ